jgi:flagellar hook-length control protein FliK
MPPLEALGEGRRQWPAEQASAPLFGPRLAPPYAAPGATSVPPAVTAETATPVLGTLNRAHLEGTPELNMVAAKPLSTADGVAGPFERRAHLATAFDDGDRAGPLPAFARASMQSPLAEPSAPLPALARAALALPAGLQQPGWNQALGERVVWLLSHDVQRAELTLNPPELGALRVRVTVTGQAASVAFASEHAPVREAVESALPQLRQVLAERGLSLDHVDVSPQQSGQRWTHGGSDSPAERQRQLAERDAVSVNEAGPAPVSLQRGLVDQYA